MQDGGVLRVVLGAVERLQVLHQLNHRVVVLDLTEADERLVGRVARLNSLS